MKTYIILIVCVLLVGCLEPKYPTNEAYNCIEAVKLLPGTGALKIRNAANTDVYIEDLKFEKASGQLGAGKISFVSKQDITLAALMQYAAATMPLYNQGILNAGIANTQMIGAHWQGAANVVSAGTGLAQALVANPAMVKAYYSATPEIQKATQDALFNALNITSRPVMYP